MARNFPGSAGKTSLLPDGAKIITSHYDTLKLWDITTGKVLNEFKTGQYITDIALSKDGAKAVFGQQDSTVKLWDVATWKSIRSFRNYSYVKCVAITPDASKVLAGGGDGTAMVWDANSGGAIDALRANVSGGPVCCVASSPDGTMALTGSNNELVKLWNVQTGRLIRTFYTHSETIASIAFSPDGSQFITTRCDKDDNFDFTIVYGSTLWNISGIGEVRGRSTVQMGRFNCTFLPNNVMRITLQSTTGAKSELTLYTASGKKLKTYAFSPAAATSEFECSLPPFLKNGIYFYRLANGKNAHTGYFGFMKSR
jgi:WD40 repeat protein